MRQIIRFWNQYARRYRLWYGLGVLCLIGTNLLTIAIPTLIQYAVDSIAQQSNDWRPAARWAALIAVAGVGVMIVRTLSRTLFFNPGRTVEFRVKAGLFEHLLSMPRRFFDQMQAGDLVSRGTNDTNAMRALIGFGTLQLFNVVFAVLMSLGRMFQIDPSLTLMCIGPMTLAALLMRWTVIRLWALQGEFLEQLSRLSDRILESYAGTTVLQAYGALRGAQDRFEVDNLRLLDLGERILVIRAWFLPVVGVIGQACVVIALFVGGKSVVAGEMTLGEFTAYISYIGILAGALRGLGFLFGAVQRGQIALGRIYEVLDSEPGRPAVTQAYPAAQAGHRISVENLDFAYPGTKVDVLKNVEFRVEPGEVIGVFGETGSGKSTLLRVLARVYDPPVGAVKLDDIDIRSTDVRGHWETVALVPQEPFLFSRTVLENIALGADTSSVQQNRLDAAVRDACLSDELAALPDGMDTVVGERGMTLSGGQRQRVALARSLYRSFDILLLDDVMSAVDHSTEKALIDAVYRRTKSKTAIIVSHRISVLANADRVLVMEDGRIIDSGAHQELISRPGPYQKAFALQAGKAS